LQSNRYGTVTQIELFLDKTLEQNAARYYEKAKQLKRKRPGVVQAIERTRRQIEQLQLDKDKAFAELAKVKKVKRVREWYEKFHWFLSSEGFLCIGGKDATSNDIVVKKHLEKDDIVLHTEAPGSPFFIVKHGQQAGEKTLSEAAQADASYSKAWKAGVTAVEVFAVKPEQVSKKALPGEYISKGAFMIYGEKKFYHPILEVAIGVLSTGQVIGGAVDAVKARAEKYVLLSPGQHKTSDVIKMVKKVLHSEENDDIMKFIPAGGCSVKK